MFIQKYEGTVNQDDGGALSYMRAFIIYFSEKYIC